MRRVFITGSINGLGKLAAQALMTEGQEVVLDARTLAVNTLAPYLLTTQVERPDRLIYMSSGRHRVAGGSLRDIDWVERRWEPGAAYSESKLYLTALVPAVVRCWPTAPSNAVNPGWVPTKIGSWRGAGATHAEAEPHQAYACAHEPGSPRWLADDLAAGVACIGRA